MTSSAVHVPVPPSSFTAMWKPELTVAIENFGRIQSAFDQRRWPELHHQDDGRRFADDPFHAEDDLRLEALDVDLDDVEGPPCESSSAGITGTTRSYRSSGVRAPTRESPGFMGGDDMGSRHRVSPRAVLWIRASDAVGPQIGLQQAVEDRVGFDGVDLDVTGESVREHAEVPDIRPDVEESGAGAEQPPEKGGRGFLPGPAPQEVRTHDLVARLHPERADVGVDLLERAAVPHG